MILRSMMCKMQRTGINKFKEMLKERYGDAKNELNHKASEADRWKIPY